jgi:hypothetical protein
MFSSILKIITGLIGGLSNIARLALWLLGKKENPENQNRIRHEQTEKDIETRDSSAATQHINDNINELERLRRKNSRRK